jgi:hypothetical protein
MQKKIIWGGGRVITVSTITGGIQFISAMLKYPFPTSQRTGCPPLRRPARGRFCSNTIFVLLCKLLAIKHNYTIAVCVHLTAKTLQWQTFLQTAHKRQLHSQDTNIFDF